MLVPSGWLEITQANLKTPMDMGPERGDFGSMLVHPTGLVHPSGSIASSGTFMYMQIHLLEQVSAGHDRYVYWRITVPLQRRFNPFLNGIEAFGIFPRHHGDARTEA